MCVSKCNYLSTTKESFGTIKTDLVGAIEVAFDSNLVNGTSIHTNVLQLPEKVQKSFESNGNFSPKDIYSLNLEGAKPSMDTAPVEKLSKTLELMHLMLQSYWGTANPEKVLQLYVNQSSTGFYTNYKVNSKSNHLQDPGFVFNFEKAHSQKMFNFQHTSKVLTDTDTHFDSVKFLSKFDDSAFNGYTTSSLHSCGIKVRPVSFEPTLFTINDFNIEYIIRNSSTTGYDVEFVSFGSFNFFYLNDKTMFDAERCYTDTSLHEKNPAIYTVYVSSHATPDEVIFTFKKEAKRVGGVRVKQREYIELVHTFADSKTILRYPPQEYTEDGNKQTILNFSGGLYNWPGFNDGFVFDGQRFIPAINYALYTIQEMYKHLVNR